MQFRYTCPKCDITYCSVSCYKSPQHLKCSEQFYKDCIQDELISNQTNTTADVKKIYEILKRIRETDAGVHPNFEFSDGLDETVDSDDESPEYNKSGEAGASVYDPFNAECAEDADTEEEDIATRLQGIDINDADEVWERLTLEERKDFQQLVQCGDIMKLLPDYKPWWIKNDQGQKKSKIVDLSAEPHITEIQEQALGMPKIKTNIFNYSDICKKSPSPCIHYNLWNILAAYSCTVRFFGGEQLTNPWEAAAHLVNLSVTLKYNTNFEDAEDAIVSVEMESLSTATAGNGTAIESREHLKNDVKQLMRTRQHKLAALSDILQILQLARQHSKRIKTEDAEFQKLFAMCSGNIELNRKQLVQLEKKIEFLLAYVVQEHGNEEETLK